MGTFVRRDREGVTVHATLPSAHMPSCPQTPTYDADTLLSHHPREIRTHHYLARLCLPTVGAERGYA